MPSDIYASKLAAGPDFFDASRDDPAPLFTAEAMMNNQIKKINLSDYLGKWVLLFFYPSDFTFV